MPNFKKFADAVNKQYKKLEQRGRLFKTNVPATELWNKYQDSYGAEHNPVFRERRVHDCNTCYSFIKRLGAVVSLNNGIKETIWDIEDYLPEPYATVAKEMAAYVKSGDISTVFLTDEKLAGKEFNIGADSIVWQHFYAEIDASLVSVDYKTIRSDIEGSVSPFRKGLEEFSVSSLEAVIDLCDTIYKGVEFKQSVQKFLEAKIAYEVASDKSVFIWENFEKYPAKLRATAIGSLIKDIEADRDVLEAVNAYGEKVDPANYKRVKSVATPAQKKAAFEEIQAKGLEASLPRRHARLEDIDVNDVLYVSEDANAVMKNPLEQLLLSESAPKKAPKTMTDIAIEDFLDDVVPNSTKIEAMVENSHLKNLVTLVAPVNPEAPNMLKWDNNFSWSYNGEMTDSALKQQVIAAGGRTGAFRFSHSWNELESNKSLMDLHVFMPGCAVPTQGEGPAVNGRRVCWNKRTDSQSGGSQDVDYTKAAPEGYVPVENITFPDVSKMPEGVYTCKIHNWRFRGTGGRGKAEIEFDGQIYEYVYPATVNNQWITVAKVTLKDGKFTIKHILEPTSSAKQEWDITTQEFVEVSTIMLSPNFWNGNKIGNKHYMFMLNGCKNPSTVRGFYNEFLHDGLRPHRKAFELISSSMTCEPEDEQLSGLGFSSTKSDTLVVKVDGRPYKVIF